MNIPVLFSLILAVLVVRPYSAQAQYHTKTVNVTLLDYESLVRMSPALRSQYIREVRAALIEFERSTNAHLPRAHADLNYIQQFENLVLPFAHADGECNDKFSAFQDGKCYFTMKATDVRVDSRYSCFNIQGGVAQCSYDPATGNAPISAYKSNQGGSAPQLRSATQTPVSGVGANNTATPSGNPLITGKTPGTVSTSTATPNSGGPTPVTGTPPLPAEAKAAAAYPTTATPGSGGQTATTTPSDNTPDTKTPTAAASPDAKKAADAGSSDTKPIPIKDTSSDLNRSLCKPKPTAAKCDDSSKSAARSKFYGSKQSGCVYAGFVSDYGGAKPAQNGCQAKSSISLGGHNFSCSGGQIVCNPLIFGVKSAGDSPQPYCTNKGATATSNCADASKGNTDLVNQLDSMKMWNDWGKFKDQLKDVCSSSSGEFQCSECDTMNDKLFAAAVKAKGQEGACKIFGSDSGAGLGSGSSGGGTPSPAPASDSGAPAEGAKDSEVIGI